MAYNIRKMKNKIILGLLFLSLFVTTSCKKYLDVNVNPNAPQYIEANQYLAPILSHMAMAPQIDGINLAKYTQVWATSTALNLYDRLGSLVSSTAFNTHFTTVYWRFGQNLVNMMDQSEAEERWDLLGVGYVIKAWGWQQLTDLHGEIPVSSAFRTDGNRTFTYDSQEDIYKEVERLLLKGIELLNRTDGLVSASYFSKNDPLYQGNRTKWKRFAYGLLAQNRSHFTNKSALYNPELVMTYVDSAFISQADDARMPYTGTSNNTKNYYSPGRANISTARQTEFIVNLLNGTAYGMVSDSLPDPRIGRMLAWSPDSTFQGLRPTYGYEVAVEKRPMNPWELPTSTPNVEAVGKYLFHNTASFPLMAYTQLQFIKAEAAYHMGNKFLALETYTKALNAHLDFVNRATSAAARPGIIPITTAERTALLKTDILPKTPEDLTLSHIMEQKFVAQWGWGMLEIWSDLRRYHYTDLDPATGVQVFRNFTLPPVDRLDADNQGEPVYRVRPHYTSEYVWNEAEIAKMGGLERNYHAKMMWIFEND